MGGAWDDYPDSTALDDPELGLDDALVEAMHDRNCYTLQAVRLQYSLSDGQLAVKRAERDALLVLLQRSREQTAAELKNKGQVYRSVGYLTGVAALLLVL